MTTPMTTIQQAKVLRMKEAWQRLGVSRSKGYELLRDPSFPKQVALGPRARGIVVEHLDAWIERQLVAR